MALAVPDSTNNGSYADAYRAAAAASRWKKYLPERIIKAVLFVCAIASIFTTVGIVSVLIFEAALFFQEVTLWEFLTNTKWTPLFASKNFGILPLVTATLLTSIGAMFVALPLGLMSAIYLSEYAPDPVRQVVKPVLEILAGIPTVVYGYFALLFVTPILRAISDDISVFNGLSASIVMGIMILPMVSSLSEDAMRSVPPFPARGRLRPGQHQAGSLDAGGDSGGPFRHSSRRHPGHFPGHRRDDDCNHRRRAKPELHPEPLCAH